MAKLFFLVGLGGFLGSIARYAVGLGAVRYLSDNFPYATFAVNILGCLLIGIFYELSGKTAWMTDEVRLFLMVGFCGGFTTFSSFSLENLDMLQNHNISGFLIYSIGSFVLGLLAVWGGIEFTKIV